MSDSPITPSVGRIVLVRGGSVSGLDMNRDRPAIVTRVWGQNCINVSVFGDAEPDVKLTSVSYADLGPDEHTEYATWRWMPYQVAKAAEDAAK